jgi:hypothetical protein
MKKEIKQRFLALEKELIPYMDTLTRSADAILEKEISEYPILVIHQEHIELGIQVIDRERVKGNWSVNVSTLEEFAMKQLIKTDKIEDFQGVYKNPKEHLCLFVVSELGAQFIFIDRIKA